MLVKERYNHRLCRHYSTEGYKILQVETGIIYDEAIDVELSEEDAENPGEYIITQPCRYTYEETDQLIVEPEPEPQPTDEISADQALAIILGEDA